MIESAPSRIRRWRGSALTFVREEFEVEPDAWQQDALNAFSSGSPEFTRIAMQACAGPGKTAVLAWCGWNFLLCYGEKGEHPKGAAVSVTHDNLKDNLWPEFAKWRDRSEILKAAFTWTKEQIFANDHPATWFMSARSWSKTADPEEQGRTLSGLHSKYILYLIDESGDIPQSVLKAAEQGLASRPEFGKILQAGNPTSLDGILYGASTILRHLWHVIRITGDPDDPKRSPRIDIDWAREQIKTYGRHDPWVMSYILGLFPPSSINTFIGPDEVMAAMERKLLPDVYSWAQKRIGVDVARFGDDRTVLFPRQGKQAFMPVQMRHPRDSAASVDIANRVMTGKARFKSEMEFFDDTVGWAHGAIDVMRANGHTPIPVNFAGDATDPRYKNKRVEMWANMIKWVQEGGALPKIPELVRELTTPTYTYTGGKMIMEEKEQIKKRLKVSPDLADALALTFAVPDMPATVIIPGMPNERGKIKSEWDPYSPDRF